MSNTKSANRNELTSTIVFLYLQQRELKVTQYCGDFTQNNEFDYNEWIMISGTCLDEATSELIIVALLRKVQLSIRCLLFGHFSMESFYLLIVSWCRNR